jgi:hypothetical protein
LTRAIDEFEHEFTVRPEFRPFKFSYPIKSTPDDVFINITNVLTATSATEFKRKNPSIPDYIAAGFKSSRMLIFGFDVLKEMRFEVTTDDILETGMQRILSHKVQLERVPLTYHINQETYLIYNEALSHGKNLMYFGIEMFMTNDELEQNKFLEIFRSEPMIVEFYTKRFDYALEHVNVILESKKQYPVWKYDVGKSKAVYFAAYNLAEMLLDEMRKYKS